MSLESVGHPWFEHGEPPVILGIGRLTQAKGFSTLIHAFSRIRENQCLARLIILGEGDERSHLEQLISELGIESEVSLPGFHQNPYFLLRNASVFVLSSLWEGLPTVLIEALACGTAIVSTNCPSGPDEILESGKYGELVPVGDSDLLSQAIVKGVERKKNIDYCRKLVQRSMDFSTNSIVKKYLETLTQKELEKY